MASTYSYLRIDDSERLYSGVFFYRYKPGQPVECFFSESDLHRPAGWKKVVGVADLDESRRVWLENGARSVELVAETKLPDSIRNYQQRR